MEVRERTVASGAADLAVWEWGEVSNPPLLALHPGVGDRRIWQWCAPSWAQAGHHVVAYDRRGFGSTSYQPETHSDLADLVAVVDATTKEPVVAVGNSMGGTLALTLALDNPEKVRGLVLIAAFASGYKFADWVACDEESAMDELIAAADQAGDTPQVTSWRLTIGWTGRSRPRAEFRALHASCFWK